MEPERQPGGPPELVPWPVLELMFGSRNVFVADWMGLGDAVPVEPPPPPPPPKLRGLGPGEIRIVDGDEHIEIEFNEEGAKFDRSDHRHKPRPSRHQRVPPKRHRPAALHHGADVSAASSGSGSPDHA